MVTEAEMKRWKKWYDSTDECPYCKDNPSPFKSWHCDRCNETGRVPKSPTSNAPSETTGETSGEKGGVEKLPTKIVCWADNKEYVECPYHTENPKDCPHWKQCDRINDNLLLAGGVTYQEGGR